jgi:integrase
LLACRCAYCSIVSPHAKAVVTRKARPPRQCIILRVTCSGSGRGVAEVTLRHDLHALPPLFQYAINHKWCFQNPVKKVKIPSDKDAVGIHVLTRSEEIAYFEGARGIPHLYDLGRLMILQGPRPSEVMATRTEHINLNNGTWNIPKSKSTAGKRTLKLVPEARAILARRIGEYSPSGWLFEGRANGTHLTDAQNGHVKTLKKTGLAFVLYDLRHTFATRMAEAGCNIVALAGHSWAHQPEDSQARYVHLSQEHLEAAMLKYGETVAMEASEETKTQSVY